MPREITIEPVSRIEGHAKITIRLDADGKVADALFHVTQFRGFEKFIEGRSLTEMPSITARICGICPVSHLVAGSKACDDLLAVEIPPAGVKLRRLMNLAQIVQSHALSFFHLSSPDMLLGFDSNPQERNIFGLIRQNPALAQKGVLLRKFGQEIIALLGGKKIHPAWVVAGGVNAPLTAESRDKILQTIPDALAIARETIVLYKKIAETFKAEIACFANFPTMFMSLVSPDGKLDHYDGLLRFCDDKGHVIEELADHRQYRNLIGEYVSSYSYLKSPYFKPKGYPAGIYRVGPLARLVNCNECGTPLADAELEEFRRRLGRAPMSTFHYHWARLIEIIYGIESIQKLLEEPDILSKFVRARRPNRPEGVGISEAPRGTLIHHYRADEHGQMRWANLVVSTGHNNLAMNRGVRQVAERFVDGNHLKEGALNRVEAVIRAFDPCLSCSTHALGQMPIHIELVSAAGEVLAEQRRD